MVEYIKGKGKEKQTISGVTGVTWDKSRNKWCARITVNKNKIHLGYFENLNDAITARFDAEKKYSKEYKAKNLYTYDKSYFDEINTEEKAYWLGYIWADGNVDKNGLHLTSIDTDHLEKFKKAINGNMPVKTYKQDKNSYGEYYGRINVYGRDLSEKINNKYNLYPARPDEGKKIVSMIPNNFIKDFLRGVLDADGTILTTEIDTVGCSICFISQKYILDLCNNYINNVLNTNIERNYTKRHMDRDGNIYNLMITGNRQVFYILDSLYRNSSVYLDRKYELYQKLLLHYKNFIGIDISTLSGKGSDVKKKAILEIRDYFNKLE